MRKLQPLDTQRPRKPTKPIALIDRGMGAILYRAATAPRRYRIAARSFLSDCLAQETRAELIDATASARTSGQPVSMALS